MVSFRESPSIWIGICHKKLYEGYLDCKMQVLSLRYRANHCKQFVKCVIHKQAIIYLICIWILNRHLKLTWSKSWSIWYLPTLDFSIYIFFLLERLCISTHFCHTCSVFLRQDYTFPPNLLTNKMKAYIDICQFPKGISLVIFPLSQESHDLDNSSSFLLDARVEKILVFSYSFT